MRLYADTYLYNETIEMVKNITGTYDDPVLYHCFWNGKLSDKHYISILSCFYFNVLNKPNRKIILWTNSPFEDNDILKVISQFCEVRYFDFLEELKDTDIPTTIINGNAVYPIYSDRIRYVLLYKYGGVWFDLDVFFLRSFDPLLSMFKEDISVYTWAELNYPNNAIFISPTKQSQKMRDFIQFMIDRGQGFGFQQSNLTFDLPVDLLVLPCSWFDGAFFWDFPDFIDGNRKFFKLANGNISIDTFAKGAFCYHWHNCWQDDIEPNSYFDQLAKDLVGRFRQL